MRLTIKDKKIRDGVVMNKKIEEIKEEIESIENQLFCLAMKDYWDRSDYEDEKYLIEKKNKLEAQLKELEK